MLLTSYQTAALTHGDDGLALSRPCKGASARNLAPCERLPSILGTHEYVRDRTKCAQRRASSQRLSGSSVPSPVTDVSVGAYTVATAMFILGALGHRANTDGTRRSASPLRGLIFAAPACGARGTELLKARKVIEVQGNVSALRGSCPSRIAAVVGRHDGLAGRGPVPARALSGDRAPGCPARAALGAVRGQLAGAGSATVLDEGRYLASVLGWPSPRVGVHGGQVIAATKRWWRNWGGGDP
jgi:hypothetical protein